MVNYRYITQFSAMGTSIILLSSSMSVNGQKGTTIAVKLALETFEHHGRKNHGLYVTKGRP